MPHTPLVSQIWAQLGLVVLILALAGCGKDSVPHSAVALPTDSGTAHQETPQKPNDDDSDPVGSNSEPTTPVAGADNEQTTPVVAEGVGLTRDEALKDAYRNAVRQIVGATVDAETVVSQDSVITDKVITLSNGTIKSHKLLSDVAEKGLFRLRIVADVKKGEVVQRLRAAKIIVKEVDTKSLVADVRSTQAKESAEKISSQQRAADAEALFEKAMKELSANIFEVSVNGGIKKESVSGDDVTISYSIAIRPNAEAFKQCSKNLQRALEASTEDHDELTLEAKEEMNDPMWRSVAINYDGIPDYHSYSYLTDTLWLLTHTNKKATRTEWIAYQLPTKTDAIRSIAERFAKQELQVKVMLLTADDSVVAVDRLTPTRSSQLRFRFPFVIDSTDTKKTLHRGTVVIAPFLFSDKWHTATEFSYSLGTTLERTMTLDLEEVAKIKKVRCELLVEK